MRKNMARAVIWLLTIFAIGAILVTIFRPQPVLVDTATVSRGGLLVTVDEDGVTRIKERYVVSTPLDGRLQRVALEVGDPVYSDATVIARMQPTDPSLLDPRAVAQARARVSAAQRRLEASRAELKKAESAVEFAETEMGRIRLLQQQRAASASEFDAAQLNFRSRSEDAKSAGFAVDIAEYELKLEQAALMLTDPESGDDVSSDRMELAVKSPIDGRVLRIYQESAAVLQAGESIMEIGDPSDLEVVADVLSYDAVRVLPGAKVELHNWGGLKPLHGEVRIVEPSGFTKLSALGVEEQRVNVIIDLTDPQEERKSLGDGFRVDAKITVWEAADVLQVPTSALFRVAGQWHVFTVRQGSAVLTSVQVEHSNGINAAVVSGVNENDTVIVHPPDDVADGVAVGDRKNAEHRQAAN